MNPPTKQIGVNTEYKAAPEVMLFVKIYECVPLYY